MDTRIIALAIPGFFLLIGIEALVSRLQGVRRYRFHDSITSLACGVGEQTVVIFTAGLALAAYVFAEHNLALMRISPSSPLAWVVVIIVVDHSFYWFHRTSHRVNVMWAGHAVHHQSQEYNLSTALRQSWIENLLAWPFYVPLAVVGFPVQMFAVASTVNTLYQFWVHTRAIGRLGPVEGFLNTPSSHRVHHAVDPKYVDKNYGGMFMIWDRLYGTYIAEAEEPIYGTVKPLASWNPLWANVEGWARIAAMARATSRLPDKLLVWVAPPDWRPADLGGRVIVPEVDRAVYRKYSVEAPPGANRYVLMQFVIIAAVLMLVMWFASMLPLTVRLGALVYIIAALVGWGGLFERKKWAPALEASRHLAGVWLAVQVNRLAMEVAIVIALASLAMLISARTSPGARS